MGPMEHPQSTERGVGSSRVCHSTRRLHMAKDGEFKNLYSLFSTISLFFGIKQLLSLI